jgi:hypothetical protein
MLPKLSAVVVSKYQEHELTFLFLMFYRRYAVTLLRTRNGKNGRLIKDWELLDLI